ncbi:hypothetical protein [Magnetococcus sp. PR-3]|uniref:hypothetical protein n=1 Tax=Magnetococcus sp. PR-3 TaxID=3120355 RepID=UPI002FCDFEFA
MTLKQVGMAALVMMGLGAGQAMAAADCAQLPTRQQEKLHYERVYEMMAYETMTLCSTKHPYFKEMDDKECKLYRKNLSEGVVRMNSILGGIKFADPKLRAISEFSANLKGCSEPFMAQKKILKAGTATLLNSMHKLEVQADECREAHERLGIWCDKQELTLKHKGKVPVTK